MRLSPECVPCILNVRMREILGSEFNDEMKMRAAKELVKSYGEMLEGSDTTTMLAWRAYRKSKELLGKDDPYAAFKKRSHEVALQLSQAVLSELESKVGFERFHYAVRASLAANFIDPGSPMGTGPEDFHHRLRELRFGVDDSEKLYLTLLQSSRVTYILDNCGEAVFDMILLKEISAMGSDIKIVVKGEPYQNDVTVREAKEYGLDEFGEVVSTGSDFPGVVPGYVSEESLSALKWADVVISKGMANYEAFLAYPPERPVFVMLVAKCDPIARSIGIRRGEAAAFFLRGAPNLLKFQ